MFKVCLQYSLKSSHVVSSGNLCTLVNELYAAVRITENPVFAMSARELAWLITADHENERAVTICRRLLKDAIAFGFIEVVYPRTRPMTYRWLGAEVNGVLVPSMEAWHRECARTVAKIAQERRWSHKLEMVSRPVENSLSYPRRDNKFLPAAGALQKW